MSRRCFDDALVTLTFCSACQRPRAADECITLLGGAWIPREMHSAGRSAPIGGQAGGTSPEA